MIPKCELISLVLSDNSIIYSKQEGSFLYHFFYNSKQTKVYESIYNAFGSKSIIRSKSEEGVEYSIKKIIENMIECFKHNKTFIDLSHKFEPQKQLKEKEEIKIERRYSETNECGECEAYSDDSIKIRFHDRTIV